MHRYQIETDNELREGKGCYLAEVLLIAAFVWALFPASAWLCSFLGGGR